MRAEDLVVQDLVEPELGVAPVVVASPESKKPVTEEKPRGGNFLLIYEGFENFQVK